MLPSLRKPNDIIRCHRVEVGYCLSILVLHLCCTYAALVLQHAQVDIHCRQLTGHPMHLVPATATVLRSCPGLA